MAVPIRRFWENGDTITADKLTQMGVLAHATVDENEDLTLDITWQTAYDSMITGIVIDTEREGVMVREYYIVWAIVRNPKQNHYTIVTQNHSGSEMIFQCSSPNGYPTTGEESSEGGEGDEGGTSVVE